MPNLEDGEAASEILMPGSRAGLPRGPFFVTR